MKEERRLGPTQRGPAARTRMGERAPRPLPRPLDPLALARYFVLTVIFATPTLKNSVSASVL